MEKSIVNPNSSQISTFLGIDYGKSKIGLAIADEETRMAFAFDTLANDKKFLENLKDIIACENVEVIILGVTGHEKDPESAEEKKKFGEMVAAKLGVKVLLHEEMFTTKMAQANIRQRGAKGIVQLDDQEAARIILQSWLDNDR